MATRIKLKRSTTATVVPTLSNLEDGEVALNIADKKLYARNGSNIIEVANQKPNTGEVTTTMLAADITNGPGQTYFVATTGSNVTTLANGSPNGKHPDTAFLTIEKALSTATSGDTIVVASGEFQEAFPLTIPDGVTLRGTNLRSTQVKPTGATSSNTAFIMSGDSHISDLTIKDFFYDSGNDDGYAFEVVSSMNSTQSPYIERVTVNTKGSVVSGSDPYGYNQGDAGRGAKLDGANLNAASLHSSVLFNECTFITPNQIGVKITNGMRVEWLNCFNYFASIGIQGITGSTGQAGAGKVRLKLGGVSGTVSASEVLYQLEDGFQSGTYTRSGSTVTLTRTAHGLVSNDYIYADFISGGATDGFYQVTKVDNDNVTFTSGSGTISSSNVTYKKAVARVVVGSNDGTYVFSAGGNKGTGEFTLVNKSPKTLSRFGDSQLDTAQKKFGTSSILLDGTEDNVKVPDDQDFGFGTANWCLEAFIRPGSVTGTQRIFDLRDGSATDTAPTMYLNGTALHYGVGNTSHINGGTLATGTWYHVAVARSGGTTKLFLDGTELGTYTDSNDYGTTTPVIIGSDYQATPTEAFNGHIDEVRISKGSARFSSAFTPTTSEYSSDINTVLLLHANGTDASTTFTDASGGTSDIRSSGGDSATSVITADYSQFGAEMRSVASACVYGQKGIQADGSGVKLIMTAHNFGYVGSGSDFTNDPSLAVQANEVEELNNGKVLYSSTDQDGDFRVGDAFSVDQETGNVQFAATSTAQSAANITLSDATGTTNIFPAFIETGNLRIAGNSVTSTTGQVIVDPSGTEDFVVNAETIVKEKIYFDTNKQASIGDAGIGSAEFAIGTPKYGGFSAYGLNSRTGITIHNQAISGVTITNEGSGYTNGTVNLNASSPPAQKATATATLNTSAGDVKTITISSGGNDYTIAPTIVFNPAGAQATAVLRNRGRLSRVDITAGGSGYVNPTVSFAAPPALGITTDTAINATTNVITVSTHGYIDGDQLTYSNGGGSDNIGLTDGTTYYVISADTNSFKLSTSSGGSAVSLSVGSGENHELVGITATGTVQHSAGAVTGITISTPGFGYTGTPITTITDSGGTGAAATAVAGYSVESATVSVGGGTYTSAPSISFSQGAGDTTGSGASGSTAIGFPISTVTLDTPGIGYTKAPVISLSGGTPTQDANITAVVDKENGNLQSLTVNVVGTNYSSVPTVVFTGGKGDGAVIQANILPLAGTISAQGSGYTPGVYTNVAFTGGANSSDAGFSAANATITIPGFTGTITNGGSGYTNNSYTNLAVYNNPTSTLAVTTATRETLAFSYNAADAYEWNVANTGASAFAFTRVSSSGTASGSNISITNEQNDVLTFNVNASGHPFWIVSALTGGAYDSQYNISSNITNNGTDNGTIVWNTKGVAPGTYYYICGSHAVMQGTITVSAYTGSVYAVGNTITGGTSGASGVVTSVTDYVVRFASVTNGPFSNGESITNGSVVGTTEASTAQTQETVFAIGGVEGAPVSALTHNTYRFDTSDSSVSVFSIASGQASASDFKSVASGTPGSSGGWTDLVLKSTAPQGSRDFSYGVYPRTGNYITVGNGTSSQGSFGDSATADVTVSGGAVTSFVLTAQGNDHKIGDVVTLSPIAIGSGSGFLYTIGSNVTGVTSVTNISSAGGPYVVGDVLSADDTNLGGGGGSGFQFQVSKVGFIESTTITDGGRGFDTTDVLEYVSPPTTSGTTYALSISGVTKTTPVDIQSDGSITTTNWSIDKDGVFNNTSSNIIVGDITATGATISGATTLQNTLGVSGITTLGSDLSVGGDATVTGNLTVNGTNSRVNNAIIDLQDGTAADPSLKFESSATTGIFHAAADRFGFTAGGTSRLEVGTTEIVTTNNIEVDSTLNSNDPFLLINSTAETIDIGAPATKLKISNNATIESAGTDANVNITISPKGTGNLILTGGTDQDFSITDGSSETFKVDTDSGDTLVSGKLDAAKLRIRENAVTNNSSAALRSFGEVLGLAVSGVGSGYTNGTYTQTATTGGSGTGLTVDVTVASGTFSAVTVYDKGQNYKIGDQITIAAVGGGSGLSVTVSDIDGQGVVLKPSAGKDILCDTTGSLVVPSGTTNQRPVTLDRVTGAIRFNTSQLQFEGYNGQDFVSLGGVRDVDQDTYVLTESSPGSDEDTFEFYNTGVNSLSISQTKLTLRTTKTFDVQGTLRIDGVTTTENPVDIQRGGISIAKFRSAKDFEICDGSTSGLRLRSVPQQGVIATIGTVTSNGNNYGAGNTYSGVASTGEFGGTGATFNVVVNGSGGISSVAIASGGTGYEVNEVIKIAGNLLGGTAVTDDITFPVASISSPTSPFARMDVIHQDYVTQMDGKPFLSLDSNGSEAGFKVNRGWASATTSYLTMFDSTGTFVELDDCRVEGGELASFPSTATIAQFDKTQYKGAKTLITIESDDGKVHMLEVTTICAAAGTTAHATVTNSITSDNNLMDATIAVVGSNVNISLSKSSAASSSSNFTGRFTTTKVKV